MREGSGLRRHPYLYKSGYRADEALEALVSLSGLHLLAGPTKAQKSKSHHKSMGIAGAGEVPKKLSDVIRACFVYPSDVDQLIPRTPSCSRR